MGLLQPRADAGRGGRLQDVDRALGVDPLERAQGGGLLSNDADEVDDRIAAGHAALERLAGQHVALHPLDRLEPPQIALGAAADQAAHHVALRAQRLDHGAPDEAGSTGHEDPPGGRHGH